MPANTLPPITRTNANDANRVTMPHPIYGSNRTLSRKLLVGNRNMTLVLFGLVRDRQRIPRLVFLNLESQKPMNGLHSFGTVGRYANPRTLLPFA